MHVSVICLPQQDSWTSSPVVKMLSVVALLDIVKYQQASPFLCLTLLPIFLCLGLAYTIHIWNCNSLSKQGRKQFHTVWTKFYLTFSSSNGLLATISGTQPYTDVLVVYLIHGRVAVKSHSYYYSELGRAIPTLITSSTYNDAVLHQCQIILTHGLRLNVDGSDRQLTYGKKLHNAWMYIISFIQNLHC